MDNLIVFLIINKSKYFAIKFTIFMITNIFQFISKFINWFKN